jgi:iron complex transport system substrate-binding protein
LLALDPPGELVAVSSFADDPRISHVVAEARAVPHRVRGKAEPILALRPDLVFTFPFGQGTTEALLRQAGVRVVHVQGARSIEGVRANVRQLGKVTGRARRAATLVTELDATLAEVRRTVARKPRPSVLFVAPGRSTAGAGTLMDELLGIAGARNAAAEAGLEGHATLTLETALETQADLILALDYRADARSRAMVPAPSLSADPLFREVPAVREGRVVSIPPKIALTSSHHIARSARFLARVVRQDAKGTPQRSAASRSREP